MITDEVRKLARMLAERYHSGLDENESSNLTKEERIQDYEWAFLEGYSERNVEVVDLTHKLNEFKMWLAGAPNLEIVELTLPLGGGGGANHFFIWGPKINSKSNEEENGGRPIQGGVLPITIERMSKIEK